MKAQMLAPFFIFFIKNLLDNSAVCASPPPPPYQWDLANSCNNVPIFTQLIDDIYQQFLQSINLNETKVIDKILIDFTFVKYASELATFRVIDNNNNNEETRPMFKAHTSVLDSRDEFVGFRGCSNKMYKLIDAEFNKNIFCPEKAIPNRVVDQIMQLIFSLAARILLCINSWRNYYSSNGIGEWQIQTLLSAYKLLAARNGDNNKGGIFPFPLQKPHLLTTFMNQPNFKNRSEQKQYIKNFNFVLKLSEFSLSYYEAYKVLEAILIETNAACHHQQQQQPYLLTNDQPAPAAAEVYTFLKQYFIAKFNHKSMKMKQYILSKSGSSIKVNKVDCALVRFGRKLEQRLMEDYSRICHPDFSEYAQRMEKECGRFK